MQPLSRVKPVKQTNWTGSRTALAKRPELSAKVAQCIAEYAEIEAHLALFLSLLLHANSDSVLAMYMGVENRTSQLRMLASAAEAALPPDHFAVIDALINTCVRPCMKERDRLAHWHWGYTDELGDALLLTEPKNKLRVLVKVVQTKARTIQEGPAVTFKHDDIFVVRDSDLEAILKRASRTQALLKFAMGTVWAATNQKGRDANLQQLSSEPEIRKWLDRQHEGRRKNREAPQPPPPPEQNGKP